jgi:rhomboid protease GluP
MTIVIFLAMVLTVAYRAATPAERERYVRSGRAFLHDAARTIDRWMQEIEPYRATLRERTPHAPVTPAIAAVAAVIVVAMLFRTGPFDGNDAIVSWGGSLGPRTSNGEWWRLVTAMFVHSNVVSLIVALIALLPLGFVLERLVGPLALASTFVVSGLFAGLFDLFAFPVAVRAGAFGAIGGLYGLTVAVMLWGVARRPRLYMPLITVKWLAASAAVFGVYVWATGALGGVVVGCAAGLLPGVMIASRVNVRRTPLIRLAFAVPVMVSAAIGTAVPLWGITDSTPVIEAVAAFEERSSTSFRSALEEFTAGRMSAKALANVIDRNIAPELEGLAHRVDSLEGVPGEQQAQLAAAVEYVHLRIESWTLRSEALHKRRMTLLAKADAKEAAALEAFRRIGPRPD